MEPILDHVQITVRDMSVAVPFYDGLLPLLRFELKKKSGAVVEEHELHRTPGNVASVCSDDGVSIRYFLRNLFLKRGYPRPSVIQVFGQSRREP